MLAFSSSVRRRRATNAFSHSATSTSQYGHAVASVRKGCKATAANACLSVSSDTLLVGLLTVMLNVGIQPTGRSQPARVGCKDGLALSRLGYKLAFNELSKKQKISVVVSDGGTLQRQERRREWSRLKRGASSERTISES